MKRLLFLSMLALPLAAEDPAPLQRSTQISLGAYNQALTDGYGHWQGLTLDGTFDPGRGGAWVGSIVTYDQNEGTGAAYTLGKYQTMGDLGFLYAAIGTSTGADFLPTFRMDLDVDLALKSGWVAGFGVSRIQVRDGHKNTLYQAGPSLYLGNWVSTLRFQWNISDPGSLESSATTLDIRHGVENLAPWQSFHLGWGSEAYQATDVMQDVGLRGISASVTAYQPVTRRWAIKGSLEWGQKNETYRRWGGTLACVLNLN